MSMIPYRDFIRADEKDNFWRPEIFREKRKRKYYYYCDDILCFDMEVCNFFVNEKTGQIYSIEDIFKEAGYMPERIEELFATLQAGALPYIWQCSIEDWVTYGRDLNEYQELLDYIAMKMEGAEAHMFVHNLSYEYSFLKSELPLEKKFFTEARNPLKFNYKNLIFRCSHRLTNLSLAKWGEKIGVPKAVGDLNYHALYSPLTDLDNKSMGYCEQDLRVMIAGLKQYRAEYGHIKEIPWTQTGRVRRDIRSLNKSVRGFNRQVAYCQPKTAEEWKVQHATYSGGLTLCNPKAAGKVIYDDVSMDRKSAYPACMLEKFPNSEFIKVPYDPIWEDGNHHICLVEFTNLKAKYSMTPLSSAKRIMIKGAVYGDDGYFEKVKNKKGKKKLWTLNNGKIKFAKRLAMYVTEVDMRLINAFYTYSECKIHSHRFATSDYLPKHIVMYMLDLYEAKTKLKHSDPELYMRAKELLNCIYGLMSSALCRDQIEEIDYDYRTVHLTREQEEKELQRLQKFPENNVMPYSWGLYITAYQRWALMSTILEVASVSDTLEEGINKCHYTDTDSTKGEYREKEMAKFEEINQRIIEWTKERCKAQDIPFEKTCPKDDQGVPQQLGIWENDAIYRGGIKYLGAKRYAFKKKETDPVSITIAGVPKAAGSCLSSVDDLREGLTFDFFNSRKNMAIYLDGDNPQVTMPDGWQVTNKTGCVIRPTSYTLKLEEEYRSLIKRYIGSKQSW